MDSKPGQSLVRRLHRIVLPQHTRRMSLCLRRGVTVLVRDAA